MVTKHDVVITLAGVDQVFAIAAHGIIGYADTTIDGTLVFEDPDPVDDVTKILFPSEAGIDITHNFTRE